MINLRIETRLGQRRIAALVGRIHDKRTGANVSELAGNAPALVEELVLPTRAEMGREN